MHICALQLVIPIERFLEPEETNVEMIRMYFQNVFSKSLIPHLSPVLYLVAVHHINRFFYTTEGSTHTKLRLAMIKQILNTKNEVGFLTNVTDMNKIFSKIIMNDLDITKKIKLKVQVQT